MVTTLGWNLTTSYDWGCRGVQVRSPKSRPLESADCIRRVGQRLEAAWNGLECSTSPQGYTNWRPAGKLEMSWFVNLFSKGIWTDRIRFRRLWRMGRNFRWLFGWNHQLLAFRRSGDLGQWQGWKFLCTCSHPQFDGRLWWMECQSPIGVVVLKDNYRNTLCLDGKTVLSSRFAPQIDPLITACTAAPMEAMWGIDRMVLVPTGRMARTSVAEAEPRPRSRFRSSVSLKMGSLQTLVVHHHHLPKSRLPKNLGYLYYNIYIYII